MNSDLAETISLKAKPFITFFETFLKKIWGLQASELRGLVLSHSLQDAMNHAQTGKTCIHEFNSSKPQALIRAQTC